jgi:hypothetical protein
MHGLCGEDQNPYRHTCSNWGSSQDAFWIFSSFLRLHKEAAFFFLVVLWLEFRGLTLAKQVLYHLSQAASPFFLL